MGCEAVGREEQGGGHWLKRSAVGRGAARAAPPSCNCRCRRPLTSPTASPVTASSKPLMTWAHAQLSVRRGGHGAVDQDAPPTQALQRWLARTLPSPITNCSGGLPTLESNTVPSSSVPVYLTCGWAARTRRHMRAPHPWRAPDQAACPPVCAPCSTDTPQQSRLAWQQARMRGTRAGRAGRPRGRGCACWMAGMCMCMSAWLWL